MNPFGGIIKQLRPARSPLVIPNGMTNRTIEDPQRLKRADHLYDFIIEIDHNTRPRIAGRGSAVFLHLARDNFAPTAGCISMTKAAMLQLLLRLGPRTRIIIG